MTIRAFVEAPAGLAAVSLRLHGGEKCRPPISRMGNKAGYAGAILGALGLRSGEGAGAYVWAESDPDVRALLRAYPDAAALLRIADIIRGWKDEEPRALWERLRAERKARPPAVDDTPAGWIVSEAWGSTGQWCGPDRGGTCGSHPPGWVGSITLDGLTDRCHRLAEYATITASNRLINVAGPDLRNTGAGGTTFGGAEFSTPAANVAGDFERVAEWALLGQWSFRRGAPESGFNAGLLEDREPTDTGGNAAKARTCEQEAGLWAPATHASAWPPVAVLPTIPDAATLSALLGTPGDLDRVVVYSDPDYRGTTGYAATCRDLIPDLALGWSEMGATVCVSEAVPMSELTAHGWHAMDITAGRNGQRRTFARVATEALTMNREPAQRVAVQVGLFG